MVLPWLISYCPNFLFIVYMAECNYVVVDFAQASITLFKQHGLSSGSCYQGHRSKNSAPNCGCQRFLWLDLKEFDLTIPPTLHPRAIEWEPTFPVTLSHVTQIWHVFFQFIHQLDTCFHCYMSLLSLFWCAHNGKRTNSYIWNLNIVIQNSIDKELCNMWLCRQLINVSLREIGNGCKEPSYGL